MIISHNSKAIFIHVHRTAGTTITNLLRIHLNDVLETTIQHSNAKTTAANLLEKHSDYYTFGFTRNPWARILSWYSLLHKQDRKSIEEEKYRFERFLICNETINDNQKTFHYNTLDYFSDESSHLKTDDIFRFEDLKVEIPRLFDKLGFTLGEIPKINESWNKDYREYYTEKSQELIAQNCKMDIEYFDYSF